MAEDKGRYYQLEQPWFTEGVSAWVVILVVIIDLGFLGYVAWNSWNVDRQSRRIFAMLEASGQSCTDSSEAGVPVRYENAPWKTSFEIPAGHFALAQQISDDGEVEIRIGRRPDAIEAATSNALQDTSVRVRIGTAEGFSRYYAKPYSGYGGYRRFTAVGRSAISYTDPAGAADSVQVIAIDDARNDREVIVTYTAILNGAETLAFDIVDSLRLASLDRQETVVKPGWKIYDQSPLHLQYPEDYRVTTPSLGRVVVQGKGGRIEIMSAFDLGETGRRGSLSPSNGDGGTPDEYFLLQYGVDLRVAYFYMDEAAPYDRGILKEIGATISLKE